MSPSDLDFADTLRAHAGWNQTTRDWSLMLQLWPDNCFIGEDNGQPAGTIISARYSDTFAWVGMLLVDPRHQRRGIGRALLEHSLQILQQQGIRRVGLDATAQGQGLYLKLGFQAYATLTRWTGSPAPQNLPPGACDDVTAQPTVEELSRSDQSAFGVARTPLFKAMTGHALHCCALRSAAPELPLSFALLRPGAVAPHLGPVIADTPGTAAALLRALFSNRSDSRIFWDVPDANTAATKLARQLRLEPQRSFVRMQLGPGPAPENWRIYYGMMDPALG